MPGWILGLSRPPLVLHVVEALTTGVARHVTDLVCFTPDVRHVVIAPARRVGDATDEAALPAMRAAGAEVHVVDMRRMPVHPVNALALGRVIGLVGRSRPDVVHGHASVGGALARLGSWPRDIPRVWTPNGLMTARPVVALERLFSRLTDCTIAVSEEERSLMLDLRLAPRDRVALIRNGVDLLPPTEAGPDLLGILGLERGTPLVGSVGRLMPQKAPLDFVAACEQIAARRPDVHFLLVGTGPLEDAIHAQVARWPDPSRFHHLRAVPALGRALGALDVFVLMSRYEGLPYSVMEAMREQVPVVVTDVVGNREAVGGGAAGRVVPAGDPRAAATAVLELLGDDRMRAELTRQGANRVASLYDVRRSCKLHGELYAALRDRLAVPLGLVG